MTIPSFKWVKIGNANITKITFADAVQLILDFAKHRDSYYIVTPNTDHILQLETNLELHAAYEGAKLVVCDGVPVLWASRFLGDSLPEVITGADLLPALCKEAALRRLRIALIGGPPGTAQQAAQNLMRQYPDLEVGFVHCPPLGFENNDIQTTEIIERLNQSEIDLVFLGVGAPKQEIWIFRNRSRIKVGALLGVGAAIEFQAGSLPRAPKIFRRLGLEWLFRLYHDPKRLGVRYFRDLYFFVIVLKQFLKGRKCGKSS